MRLNRKLVSVAAATALVAGAGLAAAAPASAATSKGTTTITFNGTIVGAVLSAGLGAYANSPAVSSIGAGTSLSFQLPAKLKSTPGAPITHKGAIIFTHGVKGKQVICNTPSIVEDGGPKNMVVKCTIAGTGTQFDGVEATVLKLDNPKSKTKKGKTTTTAGVSLATTPIDVAPVLNQLLETSAFATGLKLGNATVVLQ